MPDQHGFGNNGTESARPCQSGHGDDQMNEQDEQVAHPGNGISTSRTTAFRPIWQFAVDSIIRKNTAANLSARLSKNAAGATDALQV